MVSADLCLRFIPDILVQLKLIDPEDGLIGVLENFLVTWHYSGISYALDIQMLNFEQIIANPSLKQLYIDRVIHHKRMDLAKHADLSEGVKSSLSIFADLFWKELKKEISYENDEC
jgi:hypothetical protein